MIHELQEAGLGRVRLSPKVEALISLKGADVSSLFIIVWSLDSECMNKCE